ncbi:PH domain-containing protein [Prevotella koreensis]|uniref:PH domain-containing protein n=1 Tax=Prevotella koreensis TaxID=2490854 RepID=UPI0028E4E5C0|nr:PH domain-containing protein [Prevotella koreensis]
MKRSFIHRVSYTEVAGAGMLAILALLFFWNRTPANTMVGCLLIALDVAVIDRLLNTTYVITEDSLTIVRGRFGRKKTIKLSKIDSVEKVKTLFSHYVLIEYDGRKHTTINTLNEEEIIKILKKRGKDEL